jgi:hypothetical protein
MRTSRCYVGFHIGIAWLLLIPLLTQMQGIRLARPGPGFEVSSSIWIGYALGFGGVGALTMKQVDKEESRSCSK